jgi:hypothetical protein
MTTRSRVLAALAALALLLGLSACGSSSTPERTREDAEKPDITATPSATATPAGAKVIKVTLKGSTTDPAGVQVAVKRGQPVVLDIDADAAGQIHVHSTPEHLIAFPEGRSQAGFTIDRPGIVDVEDHTLDELIVQLEVS